MGINKLVELLLCQSNFFCSQCQASVLKPVAMTYIDRRFNELVVFYIPIITIWKGLIILIYLFLSFGIEFGSIITSKLTRVIGIYNKLAFFVFSLLPHRVI